MYDTILVPTDGSEHARRAGAHARQLAATTDATVHVLSVVDTDAAAGPFDLGGLGREYLDRLESTSREAIEDVQDVLGSGIEPRTSIRHGNPAEEILAYAEEEDVDALAMGTHGRTGIERFVAGSVTETVLRRSSVPVLTVRATQRSEPTGGYEEILLPTDGSDHARAAFADGLAIAAAFDARVHAVYVVDISVLSDGDPFPESVLDTLEEIGEAAVDDLAAEAREMDLDVVTEVRKGFPAKTLLDYVEAEDVDLIAMGTAGQTGLSRFLLGSTTERIVRHADVPVLAVNARRERTDE